MDVFYDGVISLQLVSLHALFCSFALLFFCKIMFLCALNNPTWD
jgi:hypothetical protein